MTDAINRSPVVHYVRNSSGGPRYPHICRTALVTAQNDSLHTADLAVFDPEGFRSKHGVTLSPLVFAADLVPGTWHQISDHGDLAPTATAGPVGKLEDMAASLIRTADSLSGMLRLSELERQARTTVGAARLAGKCEAETAPRIPPGAALHLRELQEKAEYIIDCTSFKGVPSRPYYRPQIRELILDAYHAGQDSGRAS